MGAERKLKILLSLITPESDYQLEQAALAERTAFRLKLSLNTTYADGDGVYQTLQILKVIQSAPELRPDAVIVEPVGTSMVQVAQAAVESNIAWVILNHDVDYVAKLRLSSQVPVFSMATDNEEVGNLQGKQINALTPPGACVLYVEGPSNSDAARHRTHGMLAAKRPDIALKHLRGDWTELSGYRAAQSWLRLGTARNARIDAVVCQNDCMAMGVRKAFQEIAGGAQRQKLMAVPFTGCDGIADKGQLYVRGGLLRATVINPQLTGVAIEILERALRSHSQPAEQTLVTPQSFPLLDKLQGA